MRNQTTSEDSVEQDLLARIEALELETRTLKEELKELRKRKTEKAKSTNFEGFQIGDRVRVKTKGKYDFTEGNVHKITATKIAFTGDKGQKTWRSPNNLTVIARPSK